MNSDNQKHNMIEKRSKDIGTWVAVTFTLLGLAFFAYDMYIVYVDQAGRFDLSDMVLMPVAASMFLIAIAGFYMIRKDRINLGAGLLFYYFVLIPPVIAVLLLQGMASIAVSYIIGLSAIVIGGVMSRRARGAAMIAALSAAVLTVAIEIWNPSFRTDTDLGGFASAATVIAAAAILFLIIRQAFVGNILTKFVIALTFIALASVAIMGTLAARSYRLGVTEEIGVNLAELANARGTEMGLAIDRDLELMKALAYSRSIRMYTADIVGEQYFVFEQDIEAMDQQWQTAVAENNENDPLILHVLNNALAFELRMFRSQFQEHVEIFITNPQGLSIASTNITSDYYQADEEWWQTAYIKGYYIGQPEYDESANINAIIMAMPIRQIGTGEIIGILRTTVNISTLTDALNAGFFGETGRTIIYLPDGQELSIRPTNEGDFQLTQDSAPISFQALVASEIPYQLVDINGTNTLAGYSRVLSPSKTYEGTAIAQLNWQVITLQDEEEALRSATTRIQTLIIIAAAIVAGAILVAFGLARVISGPVVRLNEVAEKITGGDLSAVAKVETNDEVGKLAESFNSMVAQLRELIGTLEVRVEERTKALATSTEVSRRLSTILNEKQLVSEVVTQIQTAFGYYHAHIYRVDEHSGDLIMAGGTGEAGALMLARGHKLEKGRGLVGRAAANRQAILVGNVRQDPAWVANPLLPETRSEAAVPIMMADEVLGVLDVQQDTVDGLKQEDVDLLQSIANQVAIALRNAASYTEAQEEAEREALIASISRKIQSTTSVESALEEAARELGRALGVKEARVLLEAREISIGRS